MAPRLYFNTIAAEHLLYKQFGLYTPCKIATHLWSTQIWKCVKWSLLPHVLLFSSPGVLCPPKFTLRFVLLAQYCKEMQVTKIVVAKYTAMPKWQKHTWLVLLCACWSSILSGSKTESKSETSYMNSVKLLPPTSTQHSQHKPLVVASSLDRLYDFKWALSVQPVGDTILEGYNLWWWEGRGVALW